MIFIIVHGTGAKAQSLYCNTNVPSFQVNLTGNPNGSWISPNIIRNDNCCGTTPPDVCVEFVVTLDPQSQGIVFNIFSGAMPQGSMFYQINCGPPTPVGQPICLNGVGPHYLTFCKPGNNSNQYIITSIGPASASANIVLNDGCSGMIYASGFDESTLVWTSIFPGPPGSYNSYLNCTAGCDSVIVTAQPGYPPFIDYQVCGTPLGGCAPFTCDTVRVYFNPTLGATITPINPTICFGNTTTTITAVGSGGAPPYSYSWNTGATTQSITVGVGTYTVSIGDSTNCPAATATVTVTAFTQPITANAGPDQSVCSTNPTVQLNGTVTGATGGIWSGGMGTYSPNNTTLNAMYTPSAGEITNGLVSLTLTTTGNGTCPPASDAMSIYINTFSGISQVNYTDVTCNGYNNGTATITMNGGNPPYTFVWNTTPAQSSATATGLAPGTYTVTITDANGCVSTDNVTISQPAPLTLNTAGFAASCFNQCNGQYTVIPAGGNGGYTYSWMPSGVTTPGVTNACAGSYTVIVTDMLGCSATGTANVSQPTAVTLSTSSVPSYCFQANGSASVNASGGTPGYSYMWNPSGQTNATANGLVPGSYSVTVTDANGCTAVSAVTVGNTAGVTAAIASVVNVSCSSGCNGSATASATGGNGPYGYSWTTSPAQSTATANGLCAGTYTVYITDAGNCTSTAVATITQPSPVTMASLTAPTTICVGQSLTLTATATGGTGSFTYAWSPSGPTVSPVTTTTYTVIATDASGCTSGPQTVTVTVHPPLGMVTSGNTVSCPGAPVQINASANGGNGGPYTYTWMPGNQTGSVITVSPTANTTYTVTASDNCSPSITATVQVTVQPTPVVSFSANDPMACEGSCIQFTSTSSNVSGWSWNFGDGSTSTQQNPLHCYNNVGSYSVTLMVTGTNGCTASQTNNNMIAIHPNPTADFSMTPPTTTILDPRICFNDLSTNDVVQWYWNFGDPNDQSTSASQNPCHSYSDTGTYCASLIVHNQYGCWNTVSYCLTIQPYYTIYVPNAFTPNGDGLNDVFVPKASHINEDTYHLWILDRWGNLIFESTVFQKGWDGKANGGEKIAQNDVYVWKILVEDYQGRMHSLIGSVSLIK
ncbi:MAG: PKD domain-containing protein [Bacteroidota bacterium]